MMSSYALAAAVIGAFALVACYFIHSLSQASDRSTATHALEQAVAARNYDRVDAAVVAYCHLLDKKQLDAALAWLDKAEAELKERERREETAAMEARLS